ncbi:MAG: C40 family peptidase [Clostridiales bacterium]|jgi:cell wall-associated NlpC family hydrolase|nr:C40 family peptidase [Clostridiales bacterium]
MYKKIIIVLGILVLVTTFLLDLQVGDSMASEISFGAIKVPATMVWVQPGQLRDYDSLILSENNNPRAWANGMNSAMRQWLVGKVETMLLFGEQVIILEQRGDWIKIAAVNHRTVKNSYGYPGWVPSHHVITNDAYIKNMRSAPLVAVHKPFSFIYSDMALTKKIQETSYMVTLPLIAENNNIVTVSLPDGNVGYISRSDVKKIQELSFSKTGIVEESLKFQGLGYIWGGTAAYGYDCSGFTLRLYQSQGINISRDASEQFNEGMPVNKNDLLPGDLVFFHNGSRIYHVGLYIGDGTMIHAPNSSSEIKFDSITEGNYASNYWGARRYAQETVETIRTLPPDSDSEVISAPKMPVTEPSPIEEKVSDIQPNTGTDREETIAGNKVKVEEIVVRHDPPASEDEIVKSDDTVNDDKSTFTENIPEDTIESNFDEIEILGTSSDIDSKPIVSTSTNNALPLIIAILLLIIAVLRKVRNRIE